VAKLPRRITKRLQPRLSPASQDGFPLCPLANGAVCKCGSSRGCDHPDGKASKRTRHSAAGRESTLANCSRRLRTREFRARAGARSGFWGFSVRSGLEFFCRAVGRRICRCVSKKRDATARLYAVSRCRFCCTPMRSWPRRQSSGAVRHADGHERQSKYRSAVGGRQRNHHRHEFFRRNCGQVRQQRGRFFYRQQHNPDHRDLAGWDRHR
jgi:hypothetical protein